MRNAITLAFLVVAAAPMIGIWRGHVWAKAHGMILRTTEASNTVAEQSSQTA